MAGGYTSSHALGVPIGDRRDPSATAAASRDRTPASTISPGSSLAARRAPFVYARIDDHDVPGVVVEQRRGEHGWQALVALAQTRPDGSGSLSVRWFDAARLRALPPLPTSTDT